MKNTVKKEFFIEFKELLKKYNVPFEEEYDLNISEEESPEKALLDSISISFGSNYNSLFDKNNPQPCICGHSYYRHFDSYELESSYVSCKYCRCSTYIPFNKDSMSIHIDFDVNPQNIDFFDNKVSFDFHVNIFENGELIKDFKDFVFVSLEENSLTHKFKTLESFVGYKDNITFSFKSHELEKILIVLDSCDTTINEDDFNNVLSYIKNNLF